MQNSWVHVDSCPRQYVLSIPASLHYKLDGAIRCQLPFALLLYWQTFSFTYWLSCLIQFILNWVPLYEIFCTLKLQYCTVTFHILMWIIVRCISSTDDDHQRFKHVCISSFSSVIRFFSEVSNMNVGFCSIKFSHVVQFVGIFWNRKAIWE